MPLSFNDKDAVLNSGREVLRKEAAAVFTLSSEIGDDFYNALDLLYNSPTHIIVIGLGKSGIIGHKIASTFASLGNSAFFVHAAEALHGDLGIIRPHDVIILISHSGKTAELLKIAEIVKKWGCKTIAITANKDNPLAQKTDIVLQTGVKQEADEWGIVPSCSSTATLALGDALALTLARLKGVSKEDFALRHPGGALGKQLKALKGKKNGL